MTQTARSHSTIESENLSLLLSSIGFPLLKQVNPAIKPLLEDWLPIATNYLVYEEITEQQVRQLIEEIESYPFSSTIYAAISLLSLSSSLPSLVSWASYSLLQKLIGNKKTPLSLENKTEITWLMPTTTDPASLQVSKKGEAYNLHGNAQLLGKQSANPSIVAMAQIEDTQEWGLFLLEDSKSVSAHVTSHTKQEIGSGLFFATKESPIPVSLIKKLKTEEVTYQQIAWETWLTLILASTWKQACFPQGFSMITQENEPLAVENKYIQAFLQSTFTNILQVFFYLDCQEQSKITDQIKLFSLLKSCVIREYVLQQAYQYNGLSLLLHKQNKVEEVNWSRYLELRELFSFLTPNQENLQDLLCTTSNKQSMGSVLMEQIQSASNKKINYPDLKAAYRVWQDYIGSLYLYVEKLQESQSQKPKPELSKLSLSKLNYFIGEILSVLHLLQVASTAEETLQKEDINLFYLEGEIAKKPELYTEYEAVTLACNYALTSLPCQESSIRFLEQEITPQNQNLD